MRGDCGGVEPHVAAYTSVRDAPFAGLPEQALRIDGKLPGSVFGSQQRGRPEGLWAVLRRRRPDPEHFASSRLGVAQRIRREGYPADRIGQVQQKGSGAHLSLRFTTRITLRGCDLSDRSDESPPLFPTSVAFVASVACSVALQTSAGRPPSDNS